MSIYRRLVFEQQFLVGSMRHRHDIDVLEFRAGFAPIAMSQNVMPADLAASLDFAARRHRPVKQRVEARDTNAAGCWLDVLQKSRKPSDDDTRVQFGAHARGLVEPNTRRRRGRSP